ncbi:hypothetical protein [Paenibacillus sp. 1P07SE]|uniref:hypothetical protein n=1 Tax=Paenibacillus sp. 1P07SE TaxID=3132209 RepID=UPI0039A6A87E
MSKKIGGENKYPASSGLFNKDKNTLDTRNISKVREHKCKSATAASLIGNNMGIEKVLNALLLLRIGMSVALGELDALLPLSSGLREGRRVVFFMSFSFLYVPKTLRWRGGRWLWCVIVVNVTRFTTPDGK